MSLPPKMRVQVLGRFDELIAEGQALVNSIAVTPPGRRGNVVVMYTTYNWDPQRLARWKTNCLTLLEPFVGPGNIGKQVETIAKATGEKPKVQAALGVLEALRDDFDKGFLDDLAAKIEAEVAADYMGQAEGLLREGQKGKNDHVPAAVLSGAILEKALRSLCDQQEPKVPTVTSKGDAKTLNPLIDDLRKAGVFNELKAKQLRSWADIRNKAAHGEFDQFTRGDVEQMVQGISNFLADYLS
jgi:hypothetical protein